MLKLQCCRVVRPTRGCWWGSWRNMRKLQRQYIAHCIQGAANPMVLFMWWDADPRRLRLSRSCSRYGVSHTTNSWRGGATTPPLRPIAELIHLKLNKGAAMGLLRFPECRCPEGQLIAQLIRAGASDGEISLRVQQRQFDLMIEKLRRHL